MGINIMWLAIVLLAGITGAAVFVALTSLRKVAELKVELQNRLISQNNDTAVTRNRIFSLQKKLSQFEQQLRQRNEQSISAATTSTIAAGQSRPTSEMASFDTLAARPASNLDMPEVAEPEPASPPSYDEIADKMRSRFADPESEESQSFSKAEARLLALMEEKRRQVGS